jgi:hypothetical protein
MTSVDSLSLGNSTLPSTMTCWRKLLFSFARGGTPQELAHRRLFEAHLSSALA